MKSYPPSQKYVEEQRDFNWKHTNGQMVNQEDRDKSKKIARKIQDYIKATCPTLEVKTALVLGCRTGYECEALLDIFEALVVGVDIVPEFIAEASKVIPAQCGDMHYLDFQDNIFDLIVCIGSLEHCWSPPMAIREMHRVLKPGGLAYVTADLEPDRKAYRSHYTFCDNPAEWLDLYRDCSFRVVDNWMIEATKHQGIAAILKKAL